MKVPAFLYQHVGVDFTDARQTKVATRKSIKGSWIISYGPRNIMSTDQLSVPRKWLPWMLFIANCFNSKVSQCTMRRYVNNLTLSDIFWKRITIFSESIISEFIISEMVDVCIFQIKVAKMWLIKPLFAFATIIECMLWYTSPKIYGQS